jgi:hypothetical protein
VRIVLMALLGGVAIGEMVDAAVVMIENAPSMAADARRQELACAHTLGLVRCHSLWRGQRACSCVDLGCAPTASRSTARPPASRPPSQQPADLAGMPNEKAEPAV